jgi:hypothetical protein
MLNQAPRHTDVWRSEGIAYLKPSGFYMYHLIQHTKTLHSAHRTYLCVSHNKQRQFPQTALTSWALQRRRNMFPVRYELNIIHYLEK